MFAFGEAIADAGIVVLLETRRRIRGVHLAARRADRGEVGGDRGADRVIAELDGRPAGQRLRELLEPIGIELHAPRPTRYTFARYVDGVPYVRVIRFIEGDAIALAAPVEPGHVMHVMRTGNLVGTTRADFAAVDRRIGGISALLAWSCMARHWEADASGLVGERGVYAERPTCGFRSYGEQTGMLLVNYTLAALAIGAPLS